MLLLDILHYSLQSSLQGEKGEITVELPGLTSTGSVSVVQGRGLPGPQGAPGLPGPPGVPGRVIGGSVRGQKAQTV